MKLFRPEPSALRFLELVTTARNLGFDLYDASDLPVDIEHQAFLEDENLTTATVHVQFSSPENEATGTGVVAVITADTQTFRLRGSWSRLDELAQLVRGDTPHTSLT